MKVAQNIASFNAGEFSPEMAGRTDFEKYSSALHLCENFIPIVEGPARRRPGFRIVNQTLGHGRSWLKRFDLSSTQTYYVEFANQKIRFFTNHGALLESNKTITGATAANPVVITSASHGFSNNDFVYITNMPMMRELNGKFFEIQNVTANTFELSTQASVPVDGSAYTADTSGTVARVYQIDNPYTLADLTDSEGNCTLNSYQSGDVLYLTCDNGGSWLNGYPPKKLTRLGETSWTIADYAPTNGPFNEENTTSIAMWASGTIGSVTLRSTQAVFAGPEEVGRLVRLNVISSQAAPWKTATAVTAGDYKRNGENTYVAKTTGTTGDTAPVHTNGIASDGDVLWEYLHSGYGIAKITAYTSSTQVTATVQAAQIGDTAYMPIDVVGTSFAITGITNASPAVVTATGHTFTDGQVVAIDSVAGMTEVNGRFFVVTGAAANVFSLLGVDSTGYGTYTSGGTAIKGATFGWQLGSWSNASEWPGIVSAFKQRIFFANRGVPSRYWLTVSNSFDDMSMDEYGVVTSGSAISAIAVDVVRMRWAVSSSRMLIGAANGEFILTTQSDADPFGPGNSIIDKQSAFKCRSVHGVTTGEVALYLQSAGRRIYAASYNYNVDRVSSVDTTAYARHVLVPYCIDMQYQSEPDKILWVVRSDGLLVGMTFDQEQNVNALHRHPMEGAVESIQVGLAPDGDREEVWMIANLNNKRYVGYLEKQYRSDETDIEDAFYIDYGLTYSALQTLRGLTVPAGADTVDASVTFTASGALWIASDVGKKIIVFYDGVRASATITSITSNLLAVATVNEEFTPGAVLEGGWYLSSKTISGLDHLEGLTAQTLRDGGEESDHDVADGQITLDDFPLTAQVGLQCTARLVPMRLDGGSQDGSAQGKLKRAHEITVRMADTVGGSVGPLGGRLDPIPFRTTSMAMDTPIPAFTGDKRVPFPGNSGRDDNQLTANTRPEYRNDKPFPATIVALIPHYTTS